jgi:multidrug efflux pump
MRNTLGTAVFSGMLGVTLFGLVFTPVFYFVIRGFVERRQRRKPEAETAMQTGVK